MPGSRSAIFLADLVGKQVRLPLVGRLIPIVADPRRHVAKSFYVVLDDASDGAKVGARQVTMVTIPASD